jgi:DNA-binding NtrC family response regulator
MQEDNQSGTAVVVMSQGDADQKLIRSTLKKVGFRVVSSETESEISAVLKREESLRLVVADPATPGLDFRQFLRRLHDTDPEVRVLCLCEETCENAARVPEYGVQVAAQLRRPFRRSHLLASILEATEKPLARTA